MSKRLDWSKLEARRIEAGKLLQRGVRPAEVARGLSVSRTSVNRWQQALAAGGRRSLRGAPRTGRPPLLDANDQKRHLGTTDYAAVGTDAATIKRGGDGTLLALDSPVNPLSLNVKDLRNVLTLRHTPQRLVVCDPCPAAPATGVKKCPRGLIWVNAERGISEHLIRDQPGRYMACFTLFADEIKAAPPDVRRWLERQILRALGTEPARDRSTKDSPARIGSPSKRPATDEVGPIRSLKNNLAVKGTIGMNEIDSAMQSASIQKLIAERAYELWENHGRPHGCDAIHWRAAEQEIMECLKRTQTNNPTAAAV